MTAYEQTCPGCQGIAHRYWRCVMCGGELVANGNGSATTGGMAARTTLHEGNWKSKETPEADHEID